MPVVSGQHVGAVKSRDRQYRALHREAEGPFSALELVDGLTTAPAIAFGGGQRVGPFLGGVVADWIGGSQSVLWISSALLGLAGLVALAQPSAHAQP